MAKQEITAAVLKERMSSQDILAQLREALNTFEPSSKAHEYIKSAIGYIETYKKNPHAEKADLALAQAAAQLDEIFVLNVGEHIQAALWLATV